MEDSDNENSRRKDIKGALFVWFTWHGIIEIGRARILSLGLVFFHTNAIPTSKWKLEGS